MSAIDSQRILVTGCRRSGTTFLGNLICTHKDYRYIEEPFNKAQGLKFAPPVWYPYLNESGLEKELGDFFNLKKGDFRTSIHNRTLNVTKFDVNKWELLKNVFSNFSEEPIFTRVARLAFKNRHYLSYLKTKWVGSKGYLFKDPFLAFSLDYVKAHFGFKNIAVYRNPFPYFNSMKQKNWAMSGQNFYVQEALRNRFPFINEIDPDNQDRDVQIIYEWLVVNKSLVEQSKTKDVILVDHEDVSRRPKEFLKYLSDYLNMDFSGFDQDKIRKMTTSKEDSRKNAKDVNRNSREVNLKWKKHLSQGEIELIESMTTDTLKALNDAKINF